MDSGAPGDTNWRERAACKGMDPDLWYPEAGERPDPLAQATCDGCPVRAECLEAGLAGRERYGIWGGESERGRRSILRARHGAWGGGHRRGKAG